MFVLQTWAIFTAALRFDNKRERMQKKRKSNKDSVATNYDPHCILVFAFCWNSFICFLRQIKNQSKLENAVKSNDTMRRDCNLKHSSEKWLRRGSSANVEFGSRSHSSKLHISKKLWITKNVDCSKQTRHVVIHQLQSLQISWTLLSSIIFVIDSFLSQQWKALWFLSLQLVAFNPFCRVRATNIAKESSHLHQHSICPLRNPKSFLRRLFKKLPRATRLYTSYSWRQ